jgi:predicted membrane protein (TIGR00267 family)
MIRLAIRGLVDGALSSLGVVIGAAISNNPTTILSAGLSGATANGFSNILAAFTAEKIGNYKRFQDVERQMIRTLKGTTIEKKLKRKILRGGMIDGGLSIVGGIIPVFPFFIMGVREALVLSIVLVTLLAAVLGGYTGYFSKENIFYSVVKMVFFTLLTAGICALIILLI